MPIIELIFAILVALVLTVIFSAGFRRHRGPSLIAFLVLLILLIWAAGVWIAPIGDPFFGIYWITYLIAGIVFALLLVALIPPSRPNEKRRHGETTSEEYYVFGAFFWLLIVALTLIILAGYVLDPHPAVEVNWPPEIR
jgi:hypothetical protein